MTIEEQLEQSSREHLEARVSRLETLLVAYRLAEVMDPREHFVQQAQKRLRAELFNEGRWSCQLRFAYGRMELPELLRRLGL
jgi:hypothetical protein